MHELIGWRHDIVGRREGERALRELARQVLLLVERPDDIAFVVPLLRIPTTCHVTAEEEVGIEVGRALCRQTGTDAIDEVGCDHGVDRTDIHLAGVFLGAGLDKILDQRLESEDDILKALDILQVADKVAHATLGLGELYLAILVPELVATHHGVDILHLLLRALEELLGQLVEGIVGEAGVTDDGKLIEETGQLEFGEHIIDTEHPLTIGQLGELLNHLHVLDKVHITLLGDGHLAALDLPTGVGQDIQVATETEVLLVVGQEVQMVAQIFIHHQRVFDIVAVEPDGILADRRGEGVLQHTNLIVVDVDIGKHVLHDGVQDIARLEQVVDTLGVDTLDDGLLIVRLLTINLLRDCFIDADRQDELVVIRTGLYLIDEPLFLLVLGGVEHLGLEIVERQRELLVLVVLIIVAVIQIGLFLSGYHLTHHLDGRVVFTTVAATLGFDGDLFQHAVVGLQGNLQYTLDTRVDLYRVGNVTHGCKRELPAIMTGN